MTLKQIVVDLNKGEKFDGNNYDVWYRKVRVVLVEQGVEETLLEVKEILTDHEYTQELAALEKWRKNDRIAHITLLSSMTNDLMFEYEQYATAYDIWKTLKNQFGCTSTTRLCNLTIAFDACEKLPEHTMKHYLMVMSNMIHELKSTSNILTGEQQIQAVICSLPPNWEHMRVNMTHNDNIHNFENVHRHLELEAERIQVARLSKAYVAQSCYCKVNRPKQRKASRRVVDVAVPIMASASVTKCKRGKQGDKKDKVKMPCYNCGKLGRFARGCTEPKKT